MKLVGFVIDHNFRLFCRLKFLLIRIFVINLQSVSVWSVYDLINKIYNIFV